MATASRKTKASKKTRFVLDLKVAVADGIIKVSDFEKFLAEKIKVDGKAGALGDKVSVKRDGSSVVVETEVHYAKRYFKYLTRKYLAKQSLRDFLRVVASGKNAYALKYFKIDEGDAE